MNIYKDYYQHFPKLHPQELRGTEGMKVTMIDRSQDPYYAIACGQSASWRPWKRQFTGEEILDTLMQIEQGKLWPGQAFEAVQFTFACENLSRDCTHQLVRLRIGGGFMQESGREGRWDEAPFITPLSILENTPLHESYVYQMENQIQLYRTLKSHGIPPQDARMHYGHAVAQNIWFTCNFTALLNWCSKRLCTNMGWQINTLARQIRDEVLKVFPHLGILLKSHCHKAGGHRCKDNTDFYRPGAPNNGAKVYFQYDQDQNGNVLCGKGGTFNEKEIANLIKIEHQYLSERIWL